MSAFIVISAKDSLNWIVDGIKKCRPHNPEVVTHLSIGKIKRVEEDKYLYEYTTYSKHASDGNADETLAKTTESDTPRNLFKNQIAQFLNVCENEGEQINIFLLDNPMTKEDFEQSTWLTNEIKAVYDSRAFTNFQLVRVMFSYQIDKPTDVTRQVSKMLLNEFLKLNLDEEDGFMTRILYIDNQKRNGAAMCLDKEGHDIMLPRMLCDLMMLLSNKNDSYNTAAAINSPTRMFAVGFSECMYYHDDIFEYYKLAGDRDMKAYLLESQNEETSLDYNKFPVGLEDRQRRLAPKYDIVEFTKDINLYSESIDKQIDDIIKSLKDKIIGIKNTALAEAAEKDRIATEEARNVRIDELNRAEDVQDYGAENEYVNKVPEEGSPTNDHILCKFFSRFFDCRKKKNKKLIPPVVSVDPRVADIVITKETDRVQKDYPEYIDREIIYEQYKVEDAEGDYYDGVKLDENIALYNSLLNFIQSKKFMKYLKDSCASAKNITTTEPDTNKHKNKKTVEPKLINVVQENWTLLKENIESIKKLKCLRGEYDELKVKIKELRSELESAKQSVKDFRLTEHCSSYDNLIDLDKLRESYAEGKNARIKNVMSSWEKRDEKTRTLELVYEDLKEQTKWDVYSLYYINWESPFDFIKDIDLTDVCKHLKAKSQPLVNTYTLEATRENLTSYCFYTDNPTWVSQINNNEIELQDQVQITGTQSAHTCSKICMFQFLQMSQGLIEGLVDCYEN